MSVFLTLGLVFTVSAFSTSTCFAGFSEQQSLFGLSAGSAALGDYDNDGDLDLVISGNNDVTFYTKLYTNNGSGTFTENTSTPLVGVQSGSVAWGDYDNDGHLDLIIAGHAASFVPTLKLYHNNRNGTFTENTTSGLPAVDECSVAWGDYDNDGKLDLAITGDIADVRSSRIYRNNGNGTFSHVTSAVLTGVNRSSVAWGDLDNDGDLDLVLAGVASSGNFGRCYRNNGNGTFSTMSTFTGSANNTIALGDYDNDGDLDIAAVGGFSSSTYGKLYANNGSGAMSEVTSAGLPAAYWPGMSWGDYDNDGRIDLAISGNEASGYVSRVYHNNGNGTFTDVAAGLPGVYSGCTLWGDLDNDGDLDLVLSGYTGTTWITKVIKNTGTVFNTKPSAPTGLFASGGPNGEVVFSWTASTDSQTPSSGLSYNLRIGTAYGKDDVFSGMADLTRSSGYRRVPAIGNAQKRLSWPVKGLSSGTYYWSVQAVDSAHAGSNWATERFDALFIISGTVRKLDGTPVAGLSLSYGSDLTAVTDEDGHYQIYVHQGWSGKVTSTPSGYNFVPAARQYSSISSNQTNQDFTVTIFGDMPITFENLRDPAIAWVDVDRDGDLDLIHNGYWQDGYDIRTEGRVYRNDSGVFNKVNQNALAAAAGEFDALDFDGDGDVDIAVIGESDSNYHPTSTGIIAFNDNGDFTPGIPTVDLSSSSQDLGDFDNDGKLDLIACGTHHLEPGVIAAVTELLRNTGGSLSRVMNSIVDVIAGDVEWADYDNDGDLDLALTSLNIANTRIYRNDGGSFTSIITQIPGAHKLAWVDYDCDGLPDLSICANSLVYLYRNNGGGEFSGVAAFPATEAYVQSPAWGDFDNDGNPDLAVCCYDAVRAAYKVVIHRNDSTGFTELGDEAGLADVSGIVAWGDYDRDGDLDLAAARNNRVRVLRNNQSTLNTPPSAPSGLSATMTATETTFSWNAATDAQTPTAGLTYNLRVGTTPGGSDVFSTTADPHTGLRYVPGVGNVRNNLSWKLKLPIRTYYWSVQAIDSGYAGGAWATEQVISAVRITGYVRLHDGTPVSGVAVQASTGGTSTTTDSNGYYEIWVLDGWSGTVTVSKSQYLFNPASRTYTNVVADQSNQDFTAGTIADIAADLVGLCDASLAWGDMDNDGDLDLAVCGYQPSTGDVSVIYENNGGSFVDINAGLVGSSSGNLAWADYDCDGYLDLAISGNGTRIYRNNGNKTFTDINANLLSTTDAFLAWGDYDNDGDPDLALCGHYVSAGVPCEAGRIFRNDGNGLFTDMGDLFDGVREGALAWADYDNDGDLDLVVSGISGDNNSTKLYRNNGNGTLSEAPGIELPGLKNSSVAWGDYDGDGYQDLALCGIRYTYADTYVYHNNGDGTFSQNYGYFVGMAYGSVAWGDVDNDGRLDLAVSGMPSSGSGSAIVYLYQANGSFLDIRLPIPTTINSALAWGDYDGDGKLDLAISGDGSHQGVGLITRIYRNFFWAANTPPSAPTGLSITPNGLDLTFEWNASTDSQTPASALTYNLRVGTSAGADNIFSGMANTTTGLRKIPAIGNAGSRLSWTLKGLKSGTYYASVQAVDASFAGSPWSAQQSATVSGVSIRGSVLLANGSPVPGVVVTPSAGGSSGVTNASGNYQVWVPSGWSGTLTPSASMMNFQPRSISFTNVTSDRTGQDFIAYPKLKISGHVKTYDGIGVSGAVVSATGMDDILTGSDGYYEFVMPQGWSGTVKATSDHQAFAPLERTYSNLTSDQPDQDFTSGRFLEVNTGIASGDRAAWGDYNSDGRLDVAVAGNGICKVYRNDGGDVFAEVASLTGIYNGAIAWGDYDGDGDLDLAVTGGTIDDYQSNPVSKIYRNDAGIFVDVDAGLPGYSYSAVAWADVDNDGDLDLALSGLADLNVPETKLFRNNAGNFVPMTTQLPAVFRSSLAWGDYDNDGDMDLAIMGRSNLYGPVIAKLFRNDMGTFNDSEVTLQGACNGALAWGDVDNDGDIDLLANGTVPDLSEYVGTPTGALYINDGWGAFTQQSLPIQDSMAAFGDYDADGDIDLVVAGRLTDYGFTHYPITRLLQNNNATFENVTVGIQAMYGGSAAWGDYDNDGDLDLLIAGQTNTGFATKIYKNVGWAANAAPSAPTSLTSSVNGVNLTLMWNAGSDSRTAATGLSYNLRVGTAPGKNDVFSGMTTASGARLVPSMGNAQKRLSWTLNGLKAGTYYWSVQSVDASHAASPWANERTATITGRSITGHVTTSDGSGVAGVLVSASNAGSAVTNAQGYYDLTVPTGWSGTVTVSKAPWYFNPTSRSYTSVTINLRNQDFSAGMMADSGMALTGMYSGDCAWGDYDNDGDLDLVVFGNPANDHITGGKLYRNDAGVLVDSGISLPGFTYGACAWGDYDEDGDLDLAISGLVSDISDPVAITKIYSNNGGALTETASLDGVYFSSLAWGDYDNDGDLDLAVSGLSAGSSDAITRIYRNTNGSFADIGANIPGVAAGRIAWADSDNDGDLDLALLGHTGSTLLGKVYRNDAGVFSDSGAYIKPLMHSALVWGDYDNDGDLDLATTGITSEFVPETHIYRNEGGNIFFDVPQVLPGVNEGDIDWADFDGDGDIDLVVSGANNTLGAITTVLRNDAGTFSDAQLMLPGLYNTSIASADYDNDGDIDLVITGTTQLSPSINPVLNVYKNTGAKVNTAPSAPTGLLAEKTGSQVLFTWQPSTDNETPSPGLSYNLRVGTVPGASDVFSGMSSADGTRKLPAIGNAQKQLSWVVKGVPKGVLYWSVQAIDASHKGSAWAVEQSVGQPLDLIRPVVTLNSITPPMVRAGDKVTVSVTATDNVGVVSVTANGTPLVREFFSDIWTGTIEADAVLGEHKVRIEAADAAHNIGTASGGYKTARVVMTSCKSVADDIITYAHTEWLFCLVGRVEVESGDVFLVNDGSGSVRVTKSKHGLQDGDFVAVQGMLYKDATQCFMKWPLEITVF